MKGPSGRQTDPPPLGFGTDLAWAGRALRRQPSVLCVSLATAIIPDIVRSESLLGVTIGISLSIFTLGWYGAERIFFRRQLEGVPVGLRELVGAARGYIGRFFRLAVVLGIVNLAFILILVQAGWLSFSPPPDSAEGKEIGARVEVIGLVLTILCDFALTFVTPALTYTTKYVRRALKTGLAMIRRTWPHSALYVLCPPLALNVMQTVFPLGGPVLGTVLSALLVVVGLLAKGAIAAFYLRVHGGQWEDGDARPEDDEPCGAAAA